MDVNKRKLLERIDKDQAKLIDFLSGLIQARSPNPPGDTREAAAYITRFLDSENLPYSRIAPHSEMPNIVASFECGSPGRNLVLNGHIDVFPVNASDTWTQPPWSGTVADGKIWGRGATDMKSGMTSLIFTFAYLHEIRDRLNGRLTLTCVSDEETFGPNGARYLMEHLPEVRGDTCLSGEPSGPHVIRFAEKGPLWLKFTVRTKGAHGAYTHDSESATKIAARLVCDLESITDIEQGTPGNIRAVIERSAAAIDTAMGPGSSEILQKVTLNVGIVRGGLKVNLVPSECVIEADIRLPVGVTREQVKERVDRVLVGYPQARVEEIYFAAPNWCDPDGEMINIVRDNVHTLKGFEPAPVVKLGATDTRLWRYRGIPAYGYGPSIRNMGTADEHVEIEEFLHSVRTHVLSAYDYLSRGIET